MKAPDTKPTLNFPVIRLLIGFGYTAILSAILMIFLLVTTAAEVMAAPASPISLELGIMKEQRSAAADGTTKIDLVPVARVTPGDRLVYILTYTNTGTKPINDMVLNYPLPQDVAYRAAAEGFLPPQVSVDGIHFAPSASGERITALRWQIAGEIAPGAHGTVSFKAALN